jgi:hypothetical protein
MAIFEFLQIKYFFGLFGHQKNRVGRNHSYFYFRPHQKSKMHEMRIKKTSLTCHFNGIRVVGKGMDDSNGTTGITNSLLSEVEIGTGFLFSFRLGLGLQRSSEKLNSGGCGLSH